MTEKEASHLRDSEIKVIRLSENIEALIKHCDRLSRRIEIDMVTNDKLDVVKKEMEALVKDIGRNTESNMWLWRSMFGAMLSAAVGLVVFLIQKGA